jgi:hypothetical protein
MDARYLFNLRNGGIFLTGLGSWDGSFFCAKICRLILPSVHDSVQNLVHCAVSIL